MKRDEIARILAEEIVRIAPETEAEIGGLDGSEDLRDALDLDSMDFLNLTTALHKRVGVDIPEADAGALTTLDAITDYLAKRLVS